MIHIPYASSITLMSPRCSMFAHILVLFDSFLLGLNACRVLIPKGFLGFPWSLVGLLSYCVLRRSCGSLWELLGTYGYGW